MTYYIIHKDKKIYLYDYIKDNPSFQDSEFWYKYLQKVVEYSLNNTILGYIENEEDKQMRNHAIIFSVLLSVVNNMIDLGMKSELIKNLVEKAKAKYILDEEQMKGINNLLSSTKGKNNHHLSYENIMIEQLNNEEINNITNNKTNKTNIPILSSKIKENLPIIEKKDDK